MTASVRGHDDSPGEGREALRATADLAGTVAKLVTAWLDLARAEMAVARVSATRLTFAAVLIGVLGLAFWLSACLALGYWLAGWLERMDLALALVAALNLVLAAGLLLLMRRWWRAMHLPRSRAALGDIARTLS